MKKIFSLFVACVFALAANAVDYYFAGAANGWSNNNDAWKFVEVEGVLTLNVANLYGEFKITENGSWHPQHGAQTSGDKLQFNTPYTLNKCNGSNDVPNMGIEGNYTNAKLTLQENDGKLTITIVSADGIASAKYYIVGAFNGWQLESAVEFVEVDDVLTANVADLSGTFKIVQDRSWSNQWAQNWDTKASLVLGEPYELGGKTDKDPENLSLANPFGGFKNAVLTLALDENGPTTLTLVSGELERIENDWFIPGAWQGWKCDDVARMDPVLGKENTFELSLSEFSGEFKVVYGEWAVEFGAAKGSGETWTVNTPMSLSVPCDNLKPADPSVIYTDVTFTLVVDYDNVTVDLLISAEETPTGLDSITKGNSTTKIVEDGQLVIIKNGVRYNALGTVLR